MPAPTSALRSMPDIASDASVHVAGKLAWVGMSRIEMPVRIDAGDGQIVTSPARVSAFVNLHRPDARGIHMSRLYLHLDRALGAEPLSACSLRRLLRDFLDSHADLSDRARVTIEFDQMVRRPALRSDNSGWKCYPVRISALLDSAGFNLELGTEVQYSSTCPCSAALARQLIQDRFREDFDLSAPIDAAAMLEWLGSEQGICATPHSQRSTAELRLRLAPSFAGFPLLDVIDAVEAALGTPVQTAVKREDEQAFAKLNGSNLMFCEDAARRIQGALAADERIVDFWARASHFESLHPHDAVAVVTKGIVGGYGEHDETL